MPLVAFCVGLWRPSAAMGGTRAAKNATRAAKKAKPGAPADNKTTRAPRISVGFHMLRFAVCREKMESAKTALMAAFAEQNKWKPEEWKKRAAVVMRPFRLDVQWGAASHRFRSKTMAKRRPGVGGDLPAAMVSTNAASLPLAPARHADRRGGETAVDGASSPRAQKVAEGANGSDGANGSISGLISLHRDNAAELLTKQMTALRDRIRLHPPFHMIARGRGASDGFTGATRGGMMLWAPSKLSR